MILRPVKHHLSARRIIRATKDLPSLASRHLMWIVCVIAVVSIPILFKYIDSVYLHPVSDTTTPDLSNSYLIDFNATLRQTTNHAPLPPDIEATATPSYNHTGDNVVYLGDSEGTLIDPPRFQGNIQYYPNQHGGPVSTPTAVGGD